MTTTPATTRRGPGERLRQWWEDHAQLVDAALALLLWLLMTALAVVSLAQTPTRLVVIGLVSSGQVLPLAWRRTRPEVAFALVVVTHVIQLVVLDTTLPSNVSALIGAYAVARYSTHRRVRLAGALISVVAGPLAVLDWDTYRDLSGSGRVIASCYLSGLALLCWYWGDLTRKRRELVSRLREQNEALRRDRDQRARIATQDERTRIAREMHDIVAHSLSVVVVQADGAAYSAAHAEDFDRGRAGQALETIGTTAREALAETRRLVGVLRTDDEGGPGALAYAPTGSLADLPDLVGRVADSGVTVTLEDEVGALEVPREVGLAAHRIVQESLTNVIKHAGPAAGARVRVRVRDGALHVEVLDDGRGAGAHDDGSGHGLVGMRERADSLGGSVAAGPVPGGGYRVRAVLPFADPEETT